MIKIFIFVITLLSFQSMSFSSNFARASFFPELEMKTLNKESFKIPGDFIASNNILLISFGRDMQEPIEAWDSSLKKIFDSDNKVDIFNTPLIPNPGRFVKGFINSGFRSIYKDKSVRDSIIILYVEEEVFPMLEIDEVVMKTPLIIVVDKEGVILGKVSGLANDDNIQLVISYISK